MRTFVLYTLARLGLFLGVGAILYLIVGGINLIMLVAAIVISALLSYLLLGNLRNQLATGIAERSTARTKQPKVKKGSDEAREDAALDQSVEQSVNQPADQSANQTPDQSADQTTKKSAQKTNTFHKGA